MKQQQQQQWQKQTALRCISVAPIEASPIVGKSMAPLVLTLVNVCNRVDILDASVMVNDHSAHSTVSVCHQFKQITVSGNISSIFIASMNTFS